MDRDACADDPLVYGAEFTPFPRCSCSRKRRRPIACIASIGVTIFVRLQSTPSKTFSFLLQQAPRCIHYPLLRRESQTLLGRVPTSEPEANGRHPPTSHFMEQVELGTRDGGQLKSVDTMDNKSAQPRPDAPRRTTHPAAVLKKPSVPAALTSDSPSYPRPTINNPSSASSSSSPASYSSNSLPLRPRNQVPYTRPHLRSRSHASALAPPMAPRAHSLPSVHSAGHQYPSSPSASPLLRPSSPMSSLSPRQPYSPKMRPSSPFRPRSPLPLDESTYIQQPSSYDGAFQSISEDAELNITPRSHLDNPSHTTPTFGRSQSLRRQRPSSPLHSLTPSAATSRSASATSSPSVTTRFNENFPPLHHYSSNSSFSSISTTPSSARSRSPSISSLETIEDNPDLEWEAIEADRAAKQRAAEEAEEQGDDNEPRRRGSLDLPGHRSVGFGFGRRGGDANRKRWSICGGERTVDLDLETIWED